METIVGKNIAEAVCLIIADRLILDEWTVTPESQLRADLKANDHDVQELLRDLTDAFGVKLEGHFFGEVRVGDVVLFIEANMTSLSPRIEQVPYCDGDQVKAFVSVERMGAR